MRMILAICCGFALIASAVALWEGVDHPLALTPSGYWDGNDGKWSTFWMWIGTPAQIVRLLPGTSASTSNVTQVITIEATEGCSLASPSLNSSACNSTCTRGCSFDHNASQDWTTSGLTHSPNASYGFDTISFGTDGSNYLALPCQIIEGIDTNDVFLGSFPLSPLSPNFIFYNNDPTQSLLRTLRNRYSDLISSKTWAYTAGAHYRSQYLLGSLVLGGYDANRIDPNDPMSVSVPFNNNSARDLVIGLQSITYDAPGSRGIPLLVDGIYAIIDSLTAQMWLPVEVCDEFEKAFGLRWDNEAELYLVDDNVHENLVVQNPTLTFTIGASKDHGTDNTAIDLPYAAFDLNISSPQNYNQSQRYFPIKRAQDPSQYTLGRVFLQEAYVVADYERANFKVGQALFPSTLPATSNITAILPPENLPPSVSLGQRCANLGMATLVGVVVAGTMTLIMSGTLVWW